MTSPLLSLLLACFSLIPFTSAGNLNNDLSITWGDDRGQILNDGQLLTLSLDNYSGSGFQSNNQYLFGRVYMQLKLVPGDSAGTVTTLYLSSQGPAHDEIDFEFLGNTTGNPYTLHTNIFVNGTGNKEQQFRLWFDPTKDFHTYSILWNPGHIIFFVDNVPIRDFKNMESRGIAFPKSQPMRMYSSLWNADNWATQGGRVKTNWTDAPFTASFRSFKDDDACVVEGSGGSTCPANQPASGLGAAGTGWYNQELDSASQKRLRWVKRYYMIYNYCSDVKRFPDGMPQECSVA